MSKNPNIHLSCGEFAKITGTTKETLFHYDETGVLIPDFRDENGYRYYSVFQIEFFQVISLLKELGMSLKDIKQYIDNKSPQNLIELLVHQKSVVEKKLLHLAKMRQMITDKILITSTALEKKNNEITIETCSEMRLAITNFDKKMDDRSLMLQMAKHFKECDQKNVYSPYAIGEVLSVDIARSGGFDFNCYAYCYTFVDDSYTGDNIKIKPAGNYLTIYSLTGYENLPSAYKKLLRYADMHDFAIDDSVYEDVMFDELSVNGYCEYLLRLAVRII